MFWFPGFKPCQPVVVQSCWVRSHVGAIPLGAIPWGGECVTTGCHCLKPGNQNIKGAYCHSQQGIKDQRNLHQFRTVGKLFSHGLDLEFSAGWHPHGIAPSGIAPTRDCTHTRLHLVGLHQAGLHPHGIAPNGIAPSGIAPSGIAPSGIATSGIAPSRIAPTRD